MWTCTDLTRKTRPVMPEERHNISVRSTLLDVVAQRAVSPVFQPIVDLQRGEIWGFESLTRPAPGCGFDNVVDLFDAADKYDLLWELESVARQASLDGARGWPAGVQLFLNTTPLVFADPRFAREILRSVERVAGLTPDRVVLEITEQSGEQHVAGLGEQVALLRDYGFQVAIDDVGAGASGLNRIMSLRPQWLKLNRALIQDIDRDRTRQNLVRFLQHFTRLTGVKLIAEGIEREEEMSMLIDIGVGYGQGFYLGRPGSREQTLDGQIAARMRERWSIADLARFTDPRQKAVRRYVRSAPSCDSQSSITDAAQVLRSDRSFQGLVVLSGQRIIGWCGRDAVLRKSAEATPQQPVAFAISAESIVIGPQTTVSEAMDIAAARPESASTQPLIVGGTSGLLGILTVHDLLQAAAEVCHETSSRYTSLTGLPGRARCDEHLRDSLMRYQSGEFDPSHTADAAVLDIRGLSDYNGAYGYDMGDRLISRVVGMLRAIVQKSDGEVFLGHLGDDRFLICGPHGKLQRRLVRLLRRFGSSEPGTGEGHEAGEALLAEDIRNLLQPSDRLGLRVVLVVDPFSRVGSLRDFHTMVDTLRRGPHAQRLQWSQVGESIMYVDRNDRPGQGLRLTA